MLFRSCVGTRLHDGAAQAAPFRLARCPTLGAMETADTQRAWLTLLRTPGLGAMRLRGLLAEAGDIESALDRARRCRLPGLDERARDWLRDPDPARLEADAEWLAQPPHRLLRCTDADFPPQLEQIPNAPAALFAAGDTGLLLNPQLAVVGARDRKSTRLNSSHSGESRMPSSA